MTSVSVQGRSLASDVTKTPCFDHVVITTKRHLFMKVILSFFLKLVFLKVKRNLEAK